MSFKETEFGRIYSDCKVFNLDEVYTFSSGLSKSRKEFGFGNPFVTFKDVFYNYFLPENLSELANTNEKEISRCSVKRGDVFLTRTSETSHELGKSSVALKDYPNATFNGFTKRLRPKLDGIIFPEYAGYYFRSNLFRNQINSMVTMTTRASLNNDTMAKLKIVIPKIEEQKAIAKILSDLDEKIEVNNKINKNLEEMAQAIFKQWFVDFEFPNEEGKPYKSSGGEMVESELGMIPKDWKIKKVGDYCSVRSGYAFKSKWWTESGVKVIKIKNIFNNTINFNDISYVDLDKVEKAKEFLVTTGDLVIAMTGATLGKIAIIPYITEKILVNQRVGRFFLGENPIYKLPFLYCLLKEDYIYNQIVNRGFGSAQPNISSNDIQSLNIVYPNKYYLDKFNKINKSIFEKILFNFYENKRLENLRDTLLPKLMSGEIRVPLENSEN